MESKKREGMGAIPHKKMALHSGFGRLMQIRYLLRAVFTSGRKTSIK